MTSCDDRTARLRAFLLASCVLVGALVTPVSRASATPVPTTDVVGWDWLKHSCVETDEGYRTIGTIRTHVKYLDAKKARHYQKVEISVQKLAGLGSASNKWVNVDTRKYSWSRFRGSDLPTYSTSSIRTGLMPVAGTLRIRAAITLKRVRTGYDTTVWRYTAQSDSFSCLGLSGPGET